MPRWSAPHRRLKEQERVSCWRLLLMKVNTQNTSLQSFITSCLLRRVPQHLGARAATQEETLPPWDRRSCHRHCCGETRRSPHPKGRRAAPAASDFLSRGRKGRRCTHGSSSLAFSRWMASRCSLRWASPFTHRASSADCYFPNPCTGESVFPKDGESDSGDDNVV